MNYTWTCQCCGTQFDTLPLAFASEGPAQWLQMSESERQQRGKIDADVCMIDGEDIFVRGCLDIPIVGGDDFFSWGVWVSVSKASFTRILELWEAPVIENEPPKFAWLCNNISTYPATLGLATNLHLRAGNSRPFIELEPTDHPLAIEQRQGISVERVAEIASALLRH
jgi:hypothetical protein